MFKQQRIFSLTARIGVGVSLAAAILLSSGCRNFSKSSLGSKLSPYKMEVVQGNFVSKEQAALVEPGMSRNQVRTILGTPLLVDLFEPERWDYVFSIKRQGLEPVSRRVTVFFEGEVVTRIDVPEDIYSEEEFVEYLDSNQKKKKQKVVPLEANSKQLEKAADNAQNFHEREEQMKNQAASENDAQHGSYYPPVQTQ